MTLEIISRADALARGLKQFFTGEPCKRGHVAARKVSGRTCLECARDGCARYHAENAEKIREIKARYRAGNAEKIREIKARYRTENAEKIREKDRERQACYRAENPEKAREKNVHYYAENPEKFRENNAKRRAAKRERLPLWYGEFDQFVMTEAADLAARREAVTGFAWHVDHMIPLRARAACGLHCAANLQVIPAALNLSKHNRLVLTRPGEWIRAA